MTSTLHRRDHRLVVRSRRWAARLALAGGKGANLGELVRGGFPVPDAVVVSTAAYTSVVESTDWPRRSRRACAAAEAPQTSVLPSESPPSRTELRAEILEAYAVLGARPVAVRSSATAEDLRAPRSPGSRTPT
jgi:pyruvate,water dikinase